MFLTLPGVALLAHVGFHNCRHSAITRSKALCTFPQSVSGGGMGPIPRAGDLVVTYVLCHWWFRNLAAPADHVGQAFGLPVQARDTEHLQLAR